MGFSGRVDSRFLVSCYFPYDKRKLIALWCWKMLSNFFIAIMPFLFILHRALARYLVNEDNNFIDICPSAAETHYKPVYQQYHYVRWVSQILTLA